CIDDVIAILPGDFAIAVAGIAARIRVPSDVQPVAPPLLTVVWRGQQVVDDLLPCVGRFVVQKRLHLCGGGRQRDEDEVGGADQGTAVGLGLHFPTPVFQLCQDERVDPGPRLVSIVHGGYGRLGRFAEGPPVPFLVGNAGRFPSTARRIVLRRRLGESPV